MAHAIPPPPPGRAIDMPGVRRAIRRQVRIPIGALILGAVSGATAILLGIVAGTLLLAAVIPIAIFAVVMLVLAVRDLMRPMHILGILSSSEWTRWRCERLHIGDVGTNGRRDIRQAGMNLRRKNDSFPIWLDRNARSYFLHAPGRVVWFAGDRDGRGVLTLPGGGEMILTYPHPRLFDIGGTESVSAARWRRL